MFKSIIKSIKKIFIPSSKKMATYAAEQIAKAVNQAQKEDQIAKYASIADKATEVQKFVVELLVDGKIDDVEEKEIAEKIQPLIDKIITLI